MTSATKLNAGFRTALILLTVGSTDAAWGQGARAPIPGQFAQDFVAGKVPRAEEVAAAEKDVAANPNNLEMVRRLGKAYFFQFFGGDNVSSVPKADATLNRALTLQKDDPETLAYLGALWTFHATRIDANDPAKQKANYDKGYQLLQRAESIAPRHGAVVSVASASYLELPASYGMAPHVIGMLEGMRKGMGPAFDQFSHHGRQRLLLTLGRAYALTGAPDKARANFEEALKVNQESVEASLLRAELAKLPAGD
jgi:tetratricopeptide (TPR) repeat protein